jgi:hypothetical protein
MASALNWTIARAPRLTKGPVVGPARMSTNLFTTGPFSLSRGAWAQVLVGLAGDGSYSRQIVNVTS